MYVVGDLSLMHPVVILPNSYPLDLPHLFDIYFSTYTHKKIVLLDYHMKDFVVNTSNSNQTCDIGLKNPLKLKRRSFNNLNKSSYHIFLVTTGKKRGKGSMITKPKLKLLQHHVNSRT